MQWFMLDTKAREAGPMDEDAVHEAIAAGRCLAVRSEAARRWSTPTDAGFLAEPERGPTLAELSPERAQKLLASAVATGIFRAFIALMGLSFLLALLWQAIR